ncbi:uncharacterized protein TRIREDRAFT_66077 [Trichoderma reesei QM6a]|uniref:Predicted protein n=2 Tax=Hypocrea jecorina TaxID=51453 RepID=G0RQ55_HYPJQ|nr:uncharacterized protein TRIREDRAFT_66077 [Trichoderma reesei QM6a]EGR46490.1 predicted protein [Trichoderma reesei QM6a]ETS00292.1 cellulose signaling related protein ooc1 [Trichoderma reesei RUT C-30]
MYSTWVPLFAAALCLTSGVRAFTNPCIYQSYKCGFNLLNDYGYNLTELAAAVASTPSIPPLPDVLLLQVTYRCINISGGIVGNAYCFAGCIDMNGTLVNDQCVM